MAGRISAAQEAAQRQYERAPADKKPTSRELAARHGLSESSVQKAAWWKARNQEKSK